MCNDVPQLGKSGTKYLESERAVCPERESVMVVKSAGSIALAVGSAVALCLAFLPVHGCASRGSARPVERRGLILLGVDGMDPAFLERHWSALPNLDKLRRAGDFHTLATTIPPQSPVAWSTFITGTDPGSHGIFDFVHRDAATRMPFSSLAEVEESRRTISIGDYELPLASGKIKTFRQGVPFWKLVADAGIPATVVRMPMNFPAIDCEALSLSGMGTPDMQGSFGTFSYYTNDPQESRRSVAGGRILKIDVDGLRAVLPIQGPANTFRKDKAPVRLDLVLNIDPTEQVVRADLGGQRAVLKKGDWSEWFTAEFPLIPGLAHASGTFRILVRDVHPYLHVYVSPVNIDPQDPALPISSPRSYSADLARRLGLFYTQGIAEETSALRANLITLDEFVEQSRRVLADSRRMFDYQLANFQGGLLFYYFSSVDQASHILWGKHEELLLSYYQGVDGAIGKAVAAAKPGTTVVVMSDHGFSTFDRAVHLNTWLLKEGLLSVKNESARGDKELFPNVDWSNSKAYALGINGLYLNLRGREPGGIVDASARNAVLADIAARLKAFKDPDTGAPVVRTVYFTDIAYHGDRKANAPDIVVGYRPGFRASWQTVLGALPETVVEDNRQAWIGDHCIAAEEVPGVLLSNRRIRVPDPNLTDLTVSVLREFGIPPVKEMTGRSLFQ